MHMRLAGIIHSLIYIFSIFMTILFAWEELSQSEKNKDRVMVAQIPTILRNLGFHIFEIDGLKN